VFGRRITLFRLLGFEVRLDWSWLIIALLVVWTLARGVFPTYFVNFPQASYWWMGIAGALGLFLSIVLHELGHSLVARRFGIEMRGITLFVFGGVAEMGSEPPTPGSEFLMAIAGPITSVVLGAIFYGLNRLANALVWPVTAIGVFSYLGWINLALAGFNLIPAFPLDGGRALRSILWAVTRNFTRATHISSAVGTAFAFLLMLAGVVNFIFGSFVNGIWLFVLGLFLRNASQLSYQQVVLRAALAGEHVDRFMTTDPVTIAPDTSVKDLVENYVYRYQFKTFPVTRDGQLIGCVSLKDVREIPRSEWPHHRVQDLLRPCVAETTVGPHDDAVNALTKMNHNQATRLLVVDQGRLVGILALRDLLRFLSLKLELEPAA
jgi:Zn-dependent protease/predicted transcriptional regulator